MATRQTTSRCVDLVVVVVSTIAVLLLLCPVNKSDCFSVQAIRSTTRSKINLKSLPSYSRRQHDGRSGYLFLPTSSSSSSRSFWTQLFDRSSSSPSREEEIRKKIRQLKKAGRLGKKKSQPSPETFDDESSDSAKNTYDDYVDKIQGKLGKRKSQMLGFVGGERSSTIRSEEEEVENDDEEIDFNLDRQNEGETGRRIGRIGSLPEIPSSPEPDTAVSSSSEGGKQQKISIDPSIFDRTSSKKEPEPPELTEEELIELVAEKLEEKRVREDAAIKAASKARREERARQEAQAISSTKDGQEQSSTTKRTTTGVGGTWDKKETSEDEFYQPKTGSWGAFPRPKDISKAYGGGRRVGAGFSKEDDAVAKIKTQRLLKDYRKKVGIEVPTEKEHAAEIEEALSIGQRAMERGVYATAVSALEKVTRWCSTNSKVGSKVYLDLAMAYEAVGRTKEAYQVYKTLTECRMEDVKYNAKRLLYGLEAMETMKTVSSDFTRKKTRSTFIDATGLDDFASNFDDVYQTAYIDLDGGFYKKISESVVRSTREARQILIQATGKGEVPRARVVQALRCITREFDDLLYNEISASAQEEPTAFLNGKPIVKGASSSDTGMQISLGDFNLLSSEEMIQNLKGEWRLQLLADKQGDGVSFFNTSATMQAFSIEDMTFAASGPSGLAKVELSGRFDVDDTKRILSKSAIETSNTGVGGILSMLTGGKVPDSGFPGAVSRKQQIITVDSLLLITRRAGGSRRSSTDKEYFGVWRRVVPGEGLL